MIALDLEVRCKSFLRLLIIDALHGAANFHAWREIFLRNRAQQAFITPKASSGAKVMAALKPGSWPLQFFNFRQQVVVAAVQIGDWCFAILITCLCFH